jgi:hypothetical protein
MPPPPQVTPTFTLYRGGEAVATVTGVSDLRLQRAMVDAMTPEERAAAAAEIAALEEAEAAAAEQEAAERLAKQQA